VPSAFQKLKGNLFLAYCALIAHPFKKWLRQDGLSAPERFFHHYAKEGNLVTTREERELLLGASRCIECGLCDAHVPDVPGPGLRPSLLAPAYARATPELKLMFGLLDSLPPETLKPAERVCPRRVPLVKLAAFLKTKSNELEQASKTEDG
jgi:hypothetical protein